MDTRKETTYERGSDMGNTKKILDKMEKGFDCLNKRMDKMDKRLDGMDKRLDGMDKRLDGMDKRLDGMDKRLDGVDKRLDSLEYTTKDILLTIENEIRPNIQIIAEAHMDLNRKLDEALKTENEKEIMKIRLTYLENEVRQLKEQGVSA